MPPSLIQKHRGSFLIIGVALLAIFLLVYFSPYGCHSYLGLQADLDRVNSEIEDLRTKSQELSKEIALLKSDSTYVEKIAREKYNMIKKNEIVFEEPPSKKGKRE